MGPHVCCLVPPSSLITYLHYLSCFHEGVGREGRGRRRLRHHQGNGKSMLPMLAIWSIPSPSPRQEEKETTTIKSGHVVVYVWGVGCVWCVVGGVWCVEEGENAQI